MPAISMRSVVLLILVVVIQGRTTNHSGLAFSGRPSPKRCDELCRSFMEIEKCQCAGRPAGQAGSVRVAIVNSCQSKRCRGGTVCKLFRRSGGGSRPVCMPMPKRCLSPPRRGLCVGYHIRYHFIESQKRCKPFIFGGCGNLPNDNNFINAHVCYQSCMVLRG